MNFTRQRRVKGKYAVQRREVNMKRIVIIRTHCKRCNKPICTTNKSLHGLDALKAQYGSICEDCMPVTERYEMLHKMGLGIIKPGGWYVQYTIHGNLVYLSDNSSLVNVSKRNKEVGEMASDKGMVEYTKWWIAHPWHVTKGMPVPPDCDCRYCTKARAKRRKGWIVTIGF